MWRRQREEPLLAQARPGELRLPSPLWTPDRIFAHPYRRPYCRRQRRSGCPGISNSAPSPLFQKLTSPAYVSLT
jgi:hypothetical protein